MSETSAREEPEERAAGAAASTDSHEQQAEETAETETAETESVSKDTQEQEDGKRDDLRASWLPWAGKKSDADVVIKLYVVTGKHGILRVPESFCRECHMFARRADAAAEQVDADVDVRIYSWWTHVLGALRHGGYHAPVMVVGGTRLCQGHDVPTTDEVVGAIEAAIKRKGR